MNLEGQAREVRQKFEDKDIPEQILADLYAGYTSIKNVALFVHRAKDAFPNGNCGLASLYLKHVLGRGEIVQGTYAGNPHTFLMLGERVIDITADQYGGAEVYVGPLIVPWRR